MLNRAKRRQQQKISSKPKYSLMDVQRAINIAVEMRKLTKGHLFSGALHERCVFCGVTMKTKKQCKFWFFTFMDRMQVILINPAFFKDNEIQALWVRNEDEYKDIQIPIHLIPKD